MRLLLDTQVWLWALQAPERISSDGRRTIEGADEIVVSAVSVWELAIKVSIGKLKLEGDVQRLVEETRGSLSA